MVLDAKSARWIEGRTLLLLGLAYGFAFLDRMAMTFLAPFVVGELRLDNAHVGALGAGLSITWALGAYLVSRLSDRIGRRKPILLVALVVFSCCSVLSGLARSFGTLFATRMLMGAVEGPFLPICLSIVTLASAPGRRGLNAGIVQNVFGSILGAALAPIMLVYVATQFGWHAAFYAAGIPGFLLFLLIWRFVAEPPRPAATGAVQADRRAGSIFSMLRNRNIALCAGICCLMVGSMVTGSIFLPLYFTQIRGLPAGTMAAIMAALGLCPAVGGIIVPWLSDRLGRRPPLVLFCALLGICPLAALYVHGSVMAMTAIMCLSWIGSGTFPLFMGIVPAETLSFRNEVTAMGLVVCVGELTGGVFSPLLGGWAADHYSLVAPLIIQAVLPFAAALLAIALRETNPRKAASAA